MARVGVVVLLLLLLATNGLWWLATVQSAHVHLTQATMIAPAHGYCTGEFSVRVTMHTAVGELVRCLPRCDSESWLRCPVGWSCVDEPSKDVDSWVPVGACSPPYSR
jgi:hypothetical protein